MIEKPNRRTRFRTPPDLPSPNTRNPAPESQTPVSKITTEEKTKTREILPHSVEDIFQLIQTHPNISEIKWLKYPDGIIHLALYSKGSYPKGYGGLCLSEIEFMKFKIRLKNYPHIKIINKRGS